MGQPTHAVDAFLQSCDLQENMRLDVDAEHPKPLDSGSRLVDLDQEAGFHDEQHEHDWQEPEEPWCVPPDESDETPLFSVCPRDDENTAQQVARPKRPRVQLPCASSTSPGSSSSASGDQLPSPSQATGENEGDETPARLKWRLRRKTTILTGRA